MREGKTKSSWVLKTWTDEETGRAGGREFQRLTTLLEKKFRLIEVLENCLKILKGCPRSWSVGAKIKNSENEPECSKLKVKIKSPLIRL